MKHRGDESGGVTVTACLALLALVAVTVLMAQLGVAVVGRHRAQAAADLAALAAAGGLVAGTQLACARAEEIASRMGAQVLTCVPVDWDVTVTVRVRMPPGPLGSRELHARARAGPVEDR
ncbi:Rv3654c family TadE-like protein [Nocardia jejuensis]|uniref:Rv3654c family TadE-like protein n=1 Tax=Nocardia jejuensis TaxID=328049 RepID=UPI00082D5A79|nr:Rv3654c family TadE-like protein [Nocardia jejuensis]